MSAVMQEPTEQFREPGTTTLSPNLFAEKLQLDLNDLAATIGVHRNTMRLHPESAKTQEGLRGLMKVFIELLHVKGDPTLVAFHLKNTPVRVLGGRTLLETVRDGDLEKALRYIQSISSGQNG